MPSVFDLVEKDSKEIYDLAKEKDLKGRGDMNTGQMMAELADENLGDEKWILSANKADLVDFANEIGVDSSGKKIDILKRLLRGLVSEGAGSESPIEERTHFDDMSVRKEAISKAAAKAAERSIHNGYPYVVIESFRDKDYNDPLSIQGKYMGHDCDEIIVFEAHVATRYLPNTNVDQNPIRK